MKIGSIRDRAISKGTKICGSKDGSYVKGTTPTRSWLEEGRLFRNIFVRGEKGFPTSTPRHPCHYSSFERGGEACVQEARQPGSHM